MEGSDLCQRPFITVKYYMGSSYIAKIKCYN